MRYPFWCCVIPKKITQKSFCGWWRIFNAFPSTCAFCFFPTHGQNRTRIFDTEGFVPVDNFCDVVVSPYCFTKCLIYETRNMWWVVYINAKCMYSLEIRACTIIEFVVVRNVYHVTSTWPFISWWSGAANIGYTPCI